MNIPLIGVRAHDGTEKRRRSIMRIETFLLLRTFLAYLLDHTTFRRTDDIETMQDEN